MYSTRQLVNFLKTITVRKFTLWRPYICPFGDLLAWIPEKSNICDMGCGSGAWLALLAQFRQPVCIIGIDHNPLVLTQAEILLRKLSPPCLWSVARQEIDSIPDAVGHCNVLSMIDVWHHMTHEAQHHFFAKLYNALPDGTLFLMKDIDAASPLVWMNRLHDFILDRNGDFGHETTADEAAMQIENAGFTILAIKKQRMLWYAHYTVLAQKRIL